MTPEIEAYLKANYQFDVNSGILYLNGVETGGETDQGYLRVGNKFGQFKVHRLGWFLYYGRWPRDDVHHKDGNRKNNKIDNMEEATREENIRQGWLRIADENSCIKAYHTKHGTPQFYVRVKIGRRRVTKMFRTIEAARVYRDELRGEWNAVDS